MLNFVPSCVAGHPPQSRLSSISLNRHLLMLRLVFAEEVESAKLTFILSICVDLKDYHSSVCLCALCFSWIEELHVIFQDLCMPCITSRVHLYV